MKRLLGGTILLATALAGPPIAAASDDSVARLEAVLRENENLRKEISALRERARLQTEKSSLQAKIERRERPTAPVINPAAAAPSPLSVYAADIPVKAPPTLAPISSWTGFYVGVGVGARSTETDAGPTSGLVNGVDLLPTACANMVALGGCVTGEPLHDSAFRVSVYHGFNWQVAPQWVIGVEADFGFASRRTTLGGMVYPGGNQLTGEGGDSFSVKTTWDASIRERIGFLITPTVLLYGTGGIAWMRVESSSTCSTLPVDRCGVNGPGPFSPSTITHAQTKVGWTAGGGIEAMLWANWFARGEYRYADFGTIRHSDVRTDPGGDTRAASYEVDVRAHYATLGLAYKFGPRGASIGSGGEAFAQAFTASSASRSSSWNGLYLGVGLGARSTKTDVNVTDAAFGLLTLADFCAIAGSGPCLTGAPLNGTAFRVSPYVGYNQHVAEQWILGIEGDWGWADKTTTLAGGYYPMTGAFAGLGFGSAAETFSVKTTWDASLRGRVGYLANPAVLVYGTGGVAFLHVESTSVCSTIGVCGPPLGGSPGYDPDVITRSSTLVGWTAGAGVEAMVWGNWILRGEYRYADFGTVSYTNTRVSPLPDRNEVVSYDLRVKAHTATFGLAYKFDWEPIAARF